MAYNSDGYIMIDFTEVDFRRTNQTIDGLYKRCVDVIGTNKFILVINANGRTPLPATCSFTNNQYVIDTCIYMFAISSNDNLFIRRNDVPASDIIDDSSTSVDKTWSSNKIDTELYGKQDTLTAGTNITIDENNVISSTGGAVIDDTVIVNNKVWSSLNTVEMLAPIDTVVGSPATFKTSLALPVVACTTSFSEIQDGTGEPSPTNVRNIAGIDDIILTVNGNDVVIDFGSTQYMGYIDIVNKVAHITHALDIILTSNIYSFDAHVGSPCSSGYIDVTNDVKFLESYTTQSIIDAGFKSNKLKTFYSTYTNPISINSIRPYSPSNRTRMYLFFDGSVITQLSDIATVFGNTLQIMYPLANPIDIPLTLPQIVTVAGNNTISSDTGSLTVSYKALPIDLL